MVAADGGRVVFVRRRSFKDNVNGLETCSVRPIRSGEKAGIDFLETLISRNTGNGETRLKVGFRNRIERRSSAAGRRRLDRPFRCRRSRSPNRLSRNTGYAYLAGKSLSLSLPGKCPFTPLLSFECGRRGTDTLCREVPERAYVNRTVSCDSTVITRWTAASNFRPGNGRALERPAESIRLSFSANAVNGLWRVRETAVYRVYRRYH